MGEWTGGGAHKLERSVAGGVSPSRAKMPDAWRTDLNIHSARNTANSLAPGSTRCRGAQALVEAVHENGRGHADVEAFREPVHGDLDERIGVFQHEVGRA